MTHIWLCVSKLTTIGSDNGLSPGRRQAIIWTNAGIFFIWHWWTNLSEIIIATYIFSFKKVHFKLSSGNWRPFFSRAQCVMMTSSNGNIFRVTGPLCGEFTGPGVFPTQRPVTRSFDVFFDLRLNKRLSKHSWGWWFETLPWSLWRHHNVTCRWSCSALMNRRQHHSKLVLRSFPRLPYYVWKNNNGLWISE